MPYGQNLYLASKSSEIEWNKLNFKKDDILVIYANGQDLAREKKI